MCSNSQGYYGANGSLPLAAASSAADGPAAPEGREPASVAGGPSDEELRKIWETGHLPTDEELANDDGEQDLQFLFTSDYYRWLEENPEAMAEHESKCIRAVFNAGRRFGHQPAPPAEMEVATLLQWLRNMAGAKLGGHDGLYAARTAHLLTQRYPTPVPAATETRYEFCVYDENYIDQAGGTAPTYAQALSEGRHYLAQYQQDGPHTLELRRIERLPLPAEDAQP